MPTEDKYQWERQVDVQARPEDPDDTFTSVYPAWGYPGLNRIAGSILLGEAAVAAQKTVPPGFAIHNLQAQFCRPGVWGRHVRYTVARPSTSRNFATRSVHARQNDETKAVITLSFCSADLDQHAPTPLHCLPPARADVLPIASRPINPDLDDFNTHRAMHVPDRTPYPAFSSERFDITPDAQVGDRIYRCKVRTTTPVSRPDKQILAIVHMSDMYLVDAPLWIQGLDFGILGFANADAEDDVTATPTLSRFASLNHSLHFVRLSGWDVHEGVLMEIQTRWARGRRAVVACTIRDVRGEPIATCEQEGYYVFGRRGGAERNKL